MDRSRCRLRRNNRRIRLWIWAAWALFQGFPIWVKAQTQVADPAPYLVTNLYSGPRDQRINIVVFGDGYTADQQALFQADVSNMVMTALFNIEPYGSYRSYCNIFSIPAVSVESNVDLPSSNLYHDTYFNCGYEHDGISQLLMPSNTAPVVDLLAQFIPDYSTAIMLVNDTRYGGAGHYGIAGGLAVSSKASSYEYLLRHEFGHSFGSLKDEYETATPGYSSYEAVNCTAETNRDLIKWRVWIKDATPVPTPEADTNDALAGLFEGCMYTNQNWYRPHYDSVMNGSRRNIGQVNADQLVKAFYNRTPDVIDPFTAFSPADTNVTVNAVVPLLFSVSPMVPSLHALSIQWYLDGAALPGCTSSNLLLSSFDLGNGSHVVSNVVCDATPMVRIYTNASFPSNPLSGSVAWHLSIANQPPAASPGELQFNAGTNAVDEEIGVVTICVVRSLGATGAVSIAYATSDGSAAAGWDYLAAAGTLAFPAGVFTNWIAVTILNDSAAESNKTFTVSLSNPAGGAWLGPSSNTTVTILDFDSPLVLTQNFDSSIFLPAGWSFEFGEGTIAWNVHTNYGRSNSHCARIYSDYYCDHKTKLITPALDFGSRTNSATLSFWLWMWSIEELFIDELRVFYKTGITNSWTLAAEYTYTNVSSWTSQSLALPDFGRNYYVAFEANSLDGLGLRLDDLVITASVSAVNNDTNAPSPPSGLALSACSSNGFSMTWDAASDNIGVVLYYLYRDGAYAGYTTNCSHSYTGLVPGMVYSNWIVARDLAGNTSPPSALLEATTTPDTVYSAPGITVNPQSLAVTSGAAAVFGVAATGSTPLCYFWQMDSTPLVDSPRISGSRLAQMTIAAAEKGDAGNYSVVVTNIAGAVTSTVAVLTVADAPAPDLPLAPVGVAASDGLDAAKVRVAWQPVSSATAYEIWRHTTNDATAATQLSDSVTITNYDDRSAAGGQIYYYWVKAKNALGSSAFSVSDSGWRRSAGWTYSADVDMDGDGKIDLVLYNPENGMWVIKLSASGYGIVSALLGGPASTVVPGDYDGDGKTDPAVYEEATGTWTFMLSASGYAQVTVTLGGFGCLPAPGDFDGDRKMDPSVYRESLGRWNVLLSGSDYAMVSADFGGVGYTPVQRDYDDDGKADPALYQEAAGKWDVLLSGMNYGIASANFGGSGYAPVPGDYDGDGKSDPALYQASSGNWYVMLSASGYGIASVNFGGPEYSPVPGDFDGDHKTDPGVYRESMGDWYVMLSSCGYGMATANFGGPGYGPVWLNPTGFSSGFRMLDSGDPEP